MEGRGLPLLVEITSSDVPESAPATAIVSSNSTVILIDSVGNVMLGKLHPSLVS